MGLTLRAVMLLYSVPMKPKTMTANGRALRSVMGSASTTPAADSVRTKPAQDSSCSARMKDGAGTYVTATCRQPPALR